MIVVNHYRGVIKTVNVNTSYSVAISGEVGVITSPGIFRFCYQSYVIRNYIIRTV